MLISVITAVLAMTVIALAAGLLLGYSSQRLPGRRDALVERVNDLLPQTQCAQCGYPGCRPYAAAIVNEEADINLCPPGGRETVERLARLLDRDAPPPPDDVAAVAGTVAVIDESACIGCTWCREACPVDAITGAHHYMHTVIASECTGCALCLPRCPVDCITLTA
ncbi:MAG TPA: electron transport complex subunit RsxB [Woeseiaceae bacterium]|jgi:electron transport complex protein RnfB|nr:electron transport complex subunit RsxB [Woeseiaceae bacterium]